MTDEIILGMPDLPPPPGLYQAHLLLQASVMAQQLDCPKIIWPHVVGPDPKRVGEAVDRANQIAGLADRGASKPSLVIELPLVDLTDQQIVDLTDDTGAPLWGFWPCETDGSEPCGSCHQCRRWVVAFEQDEVAWPWAAALR